MRMLYFSILLCLVTCGQGFGDESGVGQLVKQLGSDRFSERATAHTNLLATARADFLACESDLLDALFSADDPEVQKRIEDIVEEAAVFHYLQRTNRGFIGITLVKDSFRDAESNRVHAIRVTSIYTNTPGERAGLRTNDMILAVDGRRVEDWVTTEVFIGYIQSKRPGDRLSLYVPREGDVEVLTLELAPRPKAIAQAAARTSAYSIGPSSTDWFASWVKAQRRLWEKKGRFLEESP